MNSCAHDEFDRFYVAVCLRASPRVAGSTHAMPSRAFVRLSIVARRAMASMHADVSTL